MAAASQALHSGCHGRRALNMVAATPGEVNKVAFRNVGPHASRALCTIHPELPLGSGW